MSKVTEQDQNAYNRWLTSPNMKMSEAFATYREELTKEYEDKLNFYEHILSYKSIDEHLRDAELAEKLKDMKHGLLPLS